MMGDCGVMKHEQIGAKFATEKLGLPLRIGKLIEAHVNAKRYLCWKNPEYHNKLSDASKTTLKFQGGPMKKKEADEWENDPDFKNFLLMRKWDEAAKVADLEVP